MQITLGNVDFDKFEVPNNVLMTKHELINFLEKENLNRAFRFWDHNNFTFQKTFSLFSICKNHRDLINQDQELQKLTFQSLLREIDEEFDVIEVAKGAVIDKLIEISFFFFSLKVQRYEIINYLLTANICYVNEDKKNKVYDLYFEDIFDKEDLFQEFLNEELSTCYVIPTFYQKCLNLAGWLKIKNFADKIKTFLIQCTLPHLALPLFRYMKATESKKNDQIFYNETEIKLVESWLCHEKMTFEKALIELKELKKQGMEEASLQQIFNNIAQVKATNQICTTESLLSLFTFISSFHDSKQKKMVSDEIFGVILKSLEHLQKITTSPKFSFILRKELELKLDSSAFRTLFKLIAEKLLNEYEKLIPNLGEVWLITLMRLSLEEETISNLVMLVKEKRVLKKSTKEDLKKMLVCFYYNLSSLKWSSHHILQIFDEIFDNNKIPLKWKQEIFSEIFIKVRLLDFKMLNSYFHLVKKHHCVKIYDFKKLSYLPEVISKAVSNGAKNNEITADAFVGFSDHLLQLDYSRPSVLYLLRKMMLGNKHLTIQNRQEVLTKVYRWICKSCSPDLLILSMYITLIKENKCMDIFLLKDFCDFTRFVLRSVKIKNFDDISETKLLNKSLYDFFWQTFQDIEEVLLIQKNKNSDLFLHKIREKCLDVFVEKINVFINIESNVFDLKIMKVLLWIGYLTSPLKVKNSNKEMVLCTQGIKLNEKIPDFAKLVLKEAAKNPNVVAKAIKFYSTEINKFFFPKEEEKLNILSFFDDKLNDVK